MISAFENHEPQLWSGFENGGIVVAPKRNSGTSELARLDWNSRLAVAGMPPLDISQLRTTPERTSRHALDSAHSLASEGPNWSDLDDFGLSSVVSGWMRTK